MFVREVFHGDSKPQAEEMINEIRTAFKENLRKLDWMDKETRNLAEEKADAISDMIGFPGKHFLLNLFRGKLEKAYIIEAINHFYCDLRFMSFVFQITFLCHRSWMKSTRILKLMENNILRIT
jgi:Peptidase family M13